jgi:hypothetical protein
MQRTINEQLKKAASATDYARALTGDVPDSLLSVPDEVDHEQEARERGDAGIVASDSLSGGTGWNGTVVDNRGSLAVSKEEALAKLQATYQQLKEHRKNRPVKNTGLTLDAGFAKLKAKRLAEKVAADRMQKSAADEPVTWITML